MYIYTQACTQGPDQRPFLPGSQICSGGKGVSKGWLRTGLAPGKDSVSCCHFSIQLYYGL